MISRAKLGEDELLVLWKLGRKLANQKFKLTGHPRLKLASTFSFFPLTQSRTLQNCCSATAASWPTNGRSVGDTVIAVCKTAMMHEVSQSCVARVSVSRHFRGGVVVTPIPHTRHFTSTLLESASTSIALSSPFPLSLKVYIPISPALQPAR